MHQRSARLVACLALFAVLRASHATEQEAAQYSREGDFARAAESYAVLVRQNPGSLALRIELADALARDRQWERAIAEYREALKLAPDHAEALRGIATVNRWRGHIPEAREAYLKARAAAPGDAANTLGLAATEMADHDFERAGALYEEAERRWPQDAEVRQAGVSYRHLRNARLSAYYEGDVSSRTRIAGLALPFGAREEIGAEAQQELRRNYLDGSELYRRSDRRVQYSHFFALERSLELSLRESEYSYPIAPISFTAIDRFHEYRLRYAHPVTPEQTMSLRYTARPTVLLLTQDSFTAHKIEAELTSQWQPRLQTLIGTGWLHDLDPNAVSVSNATNSTLFKAGFQYSATNRLDISGRIITNPDLDSTVKSTTILQVGYEVTDANSVLLRWRGDDQKTGDDQTSVYAALRYAPSSRIWSEIGVKHSVRGPQSGFYPLVSLLWRF